MSSYVGIVQKVVFGYLMAPWKWCDFCSFFARTRGHHEETHFCRQRQFDPTRHHQPSWKHYKTYTGRRKYCSISLLLSCRGPENKGKKIRMMGQTCVVGLGDHNWVLCSPMATLSDSTMMKQSVSITDLLWL